MKIEIKDLEKVATLCERGVIPHTATVAVRYARLNKFPAVKWGGEWYSSEGMLRAYMYRGANGQARKLLA